MNSSQQTIKDIQILLERLREYLAMPSVDGRVERQDLRRELKDLLEKIDKK